MLYLRRHEEGQIISREAKLHWFCARGSYQTQTWSLLAINLDGKKVLGCFRLRNLDLDFKIRISDLQSNAKSENRFQR